MFLPLFWLKLAQWAYGDEIETKDLIMAAIGLIGAILGGAISGALTFLGVKYTISEERKKDNGIILPEIIHATDFITESFHNLYLEINSEFRWFKFYRDNGEYLNKDDEKEALLFVHEKMVKALHDLFTHDNNKILNEAKKVNYGFYSSMKNYIDTFNKDVKMFNLITEKNIKYEELEKEIYKHCKSLIEDILYYRDFSNKQRIKNISEYQSLSE